MSQFKTLLFTAVAVFVVVTVTASWVRRPTQITQEFAGHLYKQRYDEAADMLRAPCVIKPTADGDLLLIDQSGNSLEVPAAQLPFAVGGGKPDHPSDFSMTALGSSTNGILDAPAVIIYLSIDGGRVRIESIDS